MNSALNHPKKIPEGKQGQICGARVVSAGNSQRKAVVFGISGHPYRPALFAIFTRSSASAVWVANAVRIRSCSWVITPSGSAGFTPMIPRTSRELCRGINRSRDPWSVSVSYPATAPCRNAHVATAISSASSTSPGMPGNTTSRSSSGTRKVLSQEKFPGYVLQTAAKIEPVSTATARSCESAYRVPVSFSRICAASAYSRARATSRLTSDPTMIIPAKVMRYSVSLTRKFR